VNERIKELAEKANIKFGRMAILDGDPRGMARLVTYSNLEKFAELIIRECAQVCINLQDIPATEPRHCAEDIKIHFGVEE
jgi:hypothetical protein